MEESLLSLVEKGMITVSQAIQAANNPEYVQRELITRELIENKQQKIWKERTIALFLIFQKIFLKSEEKTLHSESDFYLFFLKGMINLDQELTWLKACEDLVELENRYQRILGKKGSVSEALKTLAQLPIEEKKIQ